MTNPIFSEEYKKMRRLVKNNEDKTDVCAVGFDYKCNKYVVIFKYPYKDMYFDTYEELKNIIKERKSKMRKDKLSSFQAKKQKLLKIKNLIDNQNQVWEHIRKAKNPGEIFEWQKKIILDRNIIEQIWEIVKDE